MSANMFADSTGQSYELAPPPQSFVEDVQITFDTDMMDEDEAYALQQQQQQQQQQLQQQPPNFDNAGLLANGVSIGLDTARGGEMGMGMETDTVHVSPEKVHLRGVDTMATGDIEAWERKWVGEREEGMGLVKVQWIDDSSCNLVYPSSTDARAALDLLTDPTPPMSGGITQPTPAQEADPLLIRSARICEAHPNAKLEVRIARMDDVKQKGARERSRFYLFNPEYDRGEEFERRRRERGRREPRRERDSDAPADGDYQRRRFDRREHERRVDASSTNYDDSMYDDTVPRRRRPQRSHSHSRSRSRSDSRSRSRYQSRHRSPPRRWHSRTRTRSPIPPRKEKSAIELFPETVKSEPKGLMGHHGEDRFYNPPMETVGRIEGGGEDVTKGGGIGGGQAKAVELFPEKTTGTRGKSILGLAGRQAQSQLPPSQTISQPSGRELFPEKIGNAAPPSLSLLSSSPTSLLSSTSSSTAKNGSGATDLASRITLPSSQTSSGIFGYHDNSIVGSDDAPPRKSKKLDDDLFAEKMALGRKVGLGGGGGGDLFDRIEAPGEFNGGNAGSSGSGGRRRGRRNKAADLFG